MLARSAQICVEVRLWAMRSLETKFEVVPGRKCGGKDMADWVAILRDVNCFLSKNNEGRLLGFR